MDKGDEKEKALPECGTWKHQPRRVLIGCLEKTASGGGISMHELYRHKEGKN